MFAITMGGFYLAALIRMFMILLRKCQLTNFSELDLPGLPGIPAHHPHHNTQVCAFPYPVLGMDVADTLLSNMVVRFVQLHKYSPDFTIIGKIRAFGHRFQVDRRRESKSYQFHIFKSTKHVNPTVEGP